MARDAIARQYDVEKNTVELDVQGGTITFYAKKGKSIDLDKIHESIKATRLSGNTGMRVHSLEITVVGSVQPSNSNGEKEFLLKVAGTQQQFLLIDAPANSEGGQKSSLDRLREALGRGERATTVTGRVQGWNSHFPPFLNAPPPGQSGKPALLMVTDFQTGNR